jgi:uncharacterized damage-inducible protein DinB
MHTTETLISTLENAPLIIVPMVREVPQANLKRRPKQDDWSVHEIACHLSQVHPLFFKRLDLMMKEDHPLLKPYQPDTDEAPETLLIMNLGEALDRFVNDRQRLVDELKQLSPRDWQRTGEHPEYSRYSIFIMFRHLALHDMMHAYSIEELLLRKDWA